MSFSPSFSGYSSFLPLTYQCRGGEERDSGFPSEGTSPVGEDDVRENFVLWVLEEVHFTGIRPPKKKEKK